jgi:hypothetical protein
MSTGSTMEKKYPQSFTAKLWISDGVPNVKIGRMVAFCLIRD